MAPNLGSSSISRRTVLSATGAATAMLDPEEGSVRRELPVPREDEPNLYNFPKEVFPTYRPLPWPLQIVVILSSLLLSALTSWKVNSLLWIQPLMSFKNGDFKRLFFFLIKALVLGLGLNFGLQELVACPSRVTISKLMSDYFLPSRFSHYKKLRLQPNESPIGIHYLK